MSLKNYTSRQFYQDDTDTGLEDTFEAEVGWHVLWTRSNFEKIVRDQLLDKQYDVFLPMVNQWSFRKQDTEDGNASALRRSQSQLSKSGSPVIKVPMFKGYLFVHHRIDKTAFLDISNTKGVVYILGARWNRLARIPDEQVETIKRLVDSHLPLLPYPYLKTGDRVKIVRGTLANAQGILVQSDLSKGLFVVSVSLLQRSVAVKVDFADVVPV